MISRFVRDVTSGVDWIADMIGFWGIVLTGLLVITMIAVS